MYTSVLTEYRVALYSSVPHTLETYHGNFPSPHVYTTVLDLVSEIWYTLSSIYDFHRYVIPSSVYRRGW